MIYRLVRFLNRIFLSVIIDLEFENLEKVPDSGAFIATGNHLGVLDPLIVYYALNRDDIIMLAAEYHSQYAYRRFLAKVVGGIFVDRYHADFAVLRQVLERLNAGEALIIAPEGTRSKTGGLLPGQPGSAYLAAKTGLPVLPVSVIGTEDGLIISNLKRLRRTPVKARVGDAYILPPYDRQDRAAAIQSYTEEIMCQIAAQLPVEYRGVYADHPRTQELLSKPNLGE
jgi:1-acyl-sn-glycerol-3-phosphate acyltransferase